MDLPGFAYFNGSLSLATLFITLACATVSNDVPTRANSDSGSGGIASSSAGGTGSTSLGGSAAGGTSINNSVTGGVGNGNTGGTLSTSATGGNLGLGGTTYVAVVSSIPLPYTDDFEDGNTNGWLVWNSSTSALGNWSVALDVDGTNHVLEQSNSGSSATWEVGGDVKWTDQSLSVKVKLADTSTYIYVSVRFNNPNGYYYLQAVPGSKPKIRVRNSGSTSDVCAGTTNFAGTAGSWYTFTVTAQGSTFSANINGVSVCSATDTTIATGGIAVGTDGGPAAFDDVTVTAP